MGPENRFIQRVHKHLDKAVYREKMHNPYRGGTPDVWYSGPKSDMWVEYKWNKARPTCKGLSALQVKWLDARSAEGRNVAVVCGWERGVGVYMAGGWRTDSPIYLITFDAYVQILEGWCA